MEPKLNNEKLINALTPVLSWSIASSQTEVDDQVIQNLKTALDQVDLEQTPSEEEVVHALLEFLECMADLTKTQVDDMVVSLAKSLLPAVSLTDTMNWIRNWRKLRRANRRNRRGKSSN